ncbi:MULTISPECIES: ATP-grasp domain-containing protein [Kitasatospora]|uniref:ATP-grasp domain-containing protein n=1 Tax=Kitasatospora setae (strain ATCC 33774 / DSM 43861 / JCM 3304 / KCC A-0304 / NBRC 14216 / KM-6054) TaxID=452652 RepID=E4N2G1_KITSK|nr:MULTISPECIES: ATP-grasp domain-containing protein [Kitasatospora]BAJ32345.1 hypothetical protein KSE_65860 [Kitasatospora setae KM-6054]
MNTTTAGDFWTGVKRACTGLADVRFVALGNFEVENEWAKGESGVPTTTSRTSTVLVNRMDEFALLLAGDGDQVVLKSRPDDDYLAHLVGLGLPLPEILVADEQRADRTVSEDALASPALLARLADSARSGARLLPHGMSAVEEELCAATGLASALPGAALAKAVNSKIYSRRVADDLGLRQARGWTCENVGEFEAVAKEAARSVRAGRRIGVKDAYGVSGKGIAVIDDVKRLEQLVRMLVRRAERTGDPGLSIVVEEWADKHADLNYHLTVGQDGSVRFDFVKEALTENGVHKGHRMPARLDADQFAAVRHGADLIGARLAADGYHGVVGVDALVERDGRVLPVLEINARNNMSTYQTRLQEHFLDHDALATARLYPLTLAAPVPFAELHDALAGLLFSPAERRGLLVNNFATVNAAAPGNGAGDDAPTFAGRLYAVLVARSEAELADLDRAVTDRLTTERFHHV